MASKTITKEQLKQIIKEEVERILISEGFSDIKSMKQNFAQQIQDMPSEQMSDAMKKKLLRKLKFLLTMNQLEDFYDKYIEQYWG